MNNLAPMILFAISTTVTPGPNNFMLMNSGLHFGIKKSLPHYLGICLGFPIMVLVVALGFGAIFEQHLWLKQLLKLIGAAYMLYLAFHIIISNYKSTTAQTSKPFSFFQAILFQWVNPKAWLMAIGAISIFSIMTNYFHNALAISGIFLFVCLPGVGIWLIFGKYLQKALKEVKHRRWFNYAMAICLIASISMIFVD